MENHEADKKKLYSLVASLLKGEGAFRKAMGKLMETVLRKCRKEEKKKNKTFKKTPKQIIKTLS